MKKDLNYIRKYLFPVIVVVALITISIIGITTVSAQSPTTPTPRVSIIPLPSVSVQPPVTGQVINADWTTPSPNTFTRDQPATQVVKDVMPGVVAINVSTTSFDFFNQPIEQQAAGSGWIIDSSGIIVTNNHVVEGARIVTVDLNDGRVVNASVVNTDPISDLAVIKINADNLTALPVGDSSTLAIGQTVIAIGNSLGLGISATQGIISALGITINPGTQPLYDLIQTDAAINPGNSGGPLVNLSEQVIGINSAKVSIAGVEGMGYSISLNDAMPIIQQLVQKGSFSRSFIGVSLQTVDSSIASLFNLSTQTGAMIVAIVSGSPADQAGLRLGDVIVSINGTEVVTAADAARIIRSTPVGQQLQIGYWRGNSQSTVTVTSVQGPAS